MLNIFPCALYVCMSSLEKFLFRASDRFSIGLVFFILSCKSCLYILEINAMWLYHLQMFSPILYAIFPCCLWFPLLCRKLLSLIRSHLFIVFISIIGRWIQKVNYWDLGQGMSCLYFPLRVYSISLIFRSLIHLSLFLHIVFRECSNFILLHVVDKFSQHHLLKRLSFLHCIALSPLA